MSILILISFFVLSMATPGMWEMAALRRGDRDVVLAGRQSVVESPSGDEGDLSSEPSAETIEQGEFLSLDDMAATEDLSDGPEILSDGPEILSDGPEISLPKIRLAVPAAKVIVESSPRRNHEPIFSTVSKVPVLVEPAARIAELKSVAEPSEKTVKPAIKSPLPNSVQRLPLLVANIPEPVSSIPREALKSPGKTYYYPDTNADADLLTVPKIQTGVRAEARMDNSWREPVVLLEDLNALAKYSAAAKWALETVEQIRALGAAVNGATDKASAVLAKLTDINRRGSELAVKILASDKALARRLYKANYSLQRRLDVWREIAAISSAKPADREVNGPDAQKLAMCLAKFDSVAGNSAEGRAWRDYLLVDSIKQSSANKASAEDRKMRELSQRVLARLVETPLTPNQQQFINEGPVAELRDELRRWAAEPIGAARLLRDIETYEKTGMPSDARRLAMDYQHLNAAGAEARRQLAERVDVHYRNANVRIAVTEELLNKLIPARNLEYSQVADTVLSRPTRGETMMASEISLRMLPDANRVRLALEVRGEINSATTTDAWPARIHSDSESYYVARKPLEINMNGISVWPVEVYVENDTQTRGVETPLDGVPLLGTVAKGVVKSQVEQSKPAASREVKQKIVAQATQRINAEVRQQLSAAVERMNERVFDPLNSLALDPQLISAETTEKRFTMRLRLAGEDQLGSHTPRPQAPEDSLASVQIHESVLSNGIQRLQLDGRTFTLPELSKHIAARLGRPVAWEINPEHSDVKITFAESDAIVVKCRDGQLIMTLSIAQLSKSSRKWKNFQIRAFYKPEVEGRSAQLVRHDVIHLMGQRLNAGSQIVLRGIFSRALSKNNPWGLVPENIVKEPRLSNSAITQFVIEDGWIAVALGPKPSAAATALRQRRGM